MEESQSVPTQGHDRSEKTGEALRSLREQANQALDAHRHRLSTIETELSQHVQQISDELVRDRAVGEIEGEAIQEQQEELLRCQAALATAESELEGFHQRLVRIVAEQETQQASRSEEVIRLQQQVRESEVERDRLAGEVKQLREILAQAKAEIESLRSPQHPESVDIAAQLDSQATELDQLRNQLEQAAAEVQQLGAQLEEKQDSLSQTELEFAALHEQHAKASGEYESRIAKQEEELTQFCEQQNRDSHELERLQEKLEAARCELEQLQSKECENCKTEQEQLASAQQDASDARQRLESLQAQLEAEQGELEQTKQALATVEDSHEKAATLLNDAEQRILELGNNDEAEKQLKQTQRKFELALADVQKLKQENAELHEELTRRPETDERESPELVSLRTERDALAERLEELENSSSQKVDDSARQELDELRQRFELAVEDVRQLKQENAELNERLKKGTSTSSLLDSSSGEALDWQALKAKLMAELDAEDQGDISPERKEERTSIEGAISITDHVIAEKEKEIAALTSQLEAQPAENSEEEMKLAALEALFDQDEAIQAERERLRQAQEEWQDKLREGELELSVQRAKLAREQLALEEKLASLQDESTREEESTEGKPRRRWLSALGLKDEDGK